MVHAVFASRDPACDLVAVGLLTAVSIPLALEARVLGAQIILRLKHLAVREHSSLSSGGSAPLTSASTGLAAATNTSDLTICPTSQPTARAASTAVRVPAGNSLTAMPASMPASHISNRLIRSQDRRRPL